MESQSNLSSTINSINGARLLHFTNIELRNKSKKSFCHFVASDFARDSIARTLNLNIGEGIYATAPQGTYYIDIDEYKRKQNNKITFLSLDAC